MKSWWTSSLYSHFFSSTSHMELTLRAGCWIKFCKWLAKWYAPIIITVGFIPLLMNRCYDRLLPLFKQFLLLPNRSNNFMNLHAYCSTPHFYQFCWSLILRNSFRKVPHEQLAVLQTIKKFLFFIDSEVLRKTPTLGPIIYTM